MFVEYNNYKMISILVLWLQSQRFLKLNFQFIVKTINYVEDVLPRSSKKSFTNENFVLLTSV